MSDDPIVEQAAAEVAEAIDEARETAVDSTLEADAKAAEIARLDAIERRLNDIDARVITAPIVGAPVEAATDTTAAALTQVNEAAAQVAESAATVAEASAATAAETVAPITDTAGEAVGDAIDTTASAAETTVENTAEAVESAPRKTALLFRRPFSRGE